MLNHPPRRRLQKKFAALIGARLRGRFTISSGRFRLLRPRGRRSRELALKFSPVCRLKPANAHSCRVLVPSRVPGYLSARAADAWKFSKSNAKDERAHPPRTLSKAGKSNRAGDSNDSVAQISVR